MSITLKCSVNSVMNVFSSVQSKYIRSQSAVTRIELRIRLKGNVHVVATSSGVCVHDLVGTVGVTSSGVETGLESGGSDWNVLISVPRSGWVEQEVTGVWGV